MPCLRLLRSSEDCLAIATRAIASRKRGLTPSSHAAMQSPVSAQPLAQAFEAEGPSPARKISSTPPITLSGAALPTPAGVAIGQISTHFPQRVQASSISAVRAARAASKAVSVIDTAFSSEGRQPSKIIAILPETDGMKFYRQTNSLLRAPRAIGETRTVR